MWKGTAGTLKPRPAMISAGPGNGEQDERVVLAGVQQAVADVAGGGEAGENGDEVEEDSEQCGVVVDLDEVGEVRIVVDPDEGDQRGQQGPYRGEGGELGLAQPLPEQVDEDEHPRPADEDVLGRQE